MKAEIPKSHGNTQPLSPQESLVAALRARAPTEHDVAVENDLPPAHFREFETPDGAHLSINVVSDFDPPHYLIGVQAPESQRKFQVGSTGEVAESRNNHTWYMAGFQGGEVARLARNSQGESERVMVPDQEAEQLAYMMWNSVELPTHPYSQPQSKGQGQLIDRKLTIAQLKQERARYRQSGGTRHT